MNLVSVSNGMRNLPLGEVAQQATRAAREMISMTTLTGHIQQIEYLIAQRDAGAAIVFHFRHTQGGDAYSDECLVVMEATRRLERAIGQRVFAMQEKGVLRIRGQSDKSMRGIPSFKDILPASDARSASLAFARATQEEFDHALLVCLERGMCGMNSVHDEILGKNDRARNPQSDKVVVEMLGHLDGVVAGLAIANPEDVSPEVAAEFSSVARTHMRVITRFIKEMNLAHANT